MRLPIAAFGTSTCPWPPTKSGKRCRARRRRGDASAMTEAISVRSIRPTGSRLIAGVCAAHMISHYYMLLLAPLFAFVRADFGVSYTELALALTVFNVVSGVLQTPVGFLVDRIGARVVLIA